MTIAKNDAIISYRGDNVIDFYLQLRQTLIDNFQDSMRQVRQLLGLSAQELGEIIGLTRQTINNLETKKNRMSVTQYVALCAVLDNVVNQKPELYSVLNSLLFPGTKENKLIDNVSSRLSFLDRWFCCFPDNSKVVYSLTGNDFIFNEFDLRVAASYYKIFLDDSALCTPGAKQFLEVFSSYLYETANRIIIPVRAVESLQASLLDVNSNSIRDARQAFELLTEAQRKGIIDVRGEADDPNILATFYSVLSRYKTKYRILLITQDENLAKAIMKINHNGIGGFCIVVVKITTMSELERWHDTDEEYY